MVLREFWNLPEQITAWNWNTVFTYSMLGTIWNDYQSGRKLVTGFMMHNLFFKSSWHLCHICVCYSATLLYDQILPRPLSSKLSSNLWQFLFPFSVCNRIWQKELFFDWYFKFVFNVLIFFFKSVNRNRDIHFLNTGIIIHRLIINNI